MTIGESAAYLRSKYSRFGQKEIWDTDKHGDSFCEIVYPNESQPNLPITVTITEDGCYISVGQIEKITGNKPISVNQAVEAIDDVINDRIFFVLCYADGKEMGLDAPYFTRIFALTDREDDMRDDLDRFMKRISKPVKGLARKLTPLKGKFYFTSFSGEHNQTIYR